jgi:hypothetical protein
VNEPTLSAAFKVGYRWRCTLAAPLAGIDPSGSLMPLRLTARWWPRVPPRPSIRELSDYRRGRDAFIAEVARVIGGNVLLVERGNGVMSVVKSAPRHARANISKLKGAYPHRKNTPCPGTARVGGSGGVAATPVVDLPWRSRSGKPWRVEVPTAVAALVAILNDLGAPPAARVSAARCILDHAIGRPLQAVALAAQEGPRDVDMTTEEPRF